MEATYWHRQTLETPLFDDMLWSRPENKRHAGKLLIIGGNLHGFSAPAQAYSDCVKAGAGTAKVLLPNALQKTVSSILENGDYAPSTPSGSFSRQAMATWIDAAAWADGTLLAGDLGRNSETAITIEQFCTKYTGPLTITKDAIDYFYTNPSVILDRPNTALVLSLAQLQKLCQTAKWPDPVTFGMDLLQLVDLLHALTSQKSLTIVVYHLESILVASRGMVSSTRVGSRDSWRSITASYATVWWIQNQQKPFEAITTSIFDAFGP